MAGSGRLVLKEWDVDLKICNGRWDFEVGFGKDSNTITYL